MITLTKARSGFARLGALAALFSVGGVLVLLLGRQLAEGQSREPVSASVDLVMKRRGWAALGRGEVATALRLSYEQRRRIRRIILSADMGPSGLIGALLDPSPTRDGYVRIAGVFADMPADHAGLQEGDLIKSVDGHSVVGRDLEDVVLNIRGAPDTPVRIVVVRDAELRMLDIARQRVNFGYGFGRAQRESRARMAMLEVLTPGQQRAWFRLLDRTLDLPSDL